MPFAPPLPYRCIDKQPYIKYNHAVKTIDHAGVAEQVDARDLKSREGNLVPVRFRSPAPSK